MIGGSMKRVVMCVNDWPEEDQHDFEVFDVQEGESDKDAFFRAGEEYSHDHEFYIVEVEKK
jgi:hypothetical protein